MSEEATAEFNVAMTDVADAVSRMYDCIRRGAVISVGERLALEKISEGYQDRCTAIEEEAWSMMAAEQPARAALKDEGVGA
jgi:hypothetical protein